MARTRTRKTRKEKPLTAEQKKKQRIAAACDAIIGSVKDALESVGLALNKTKDGKGFQSHKSPSGAYIILGVMDYPKSAKQRVKTLRFEVAYPCIEPWYVSGGLPSDLRTALQAEVNTKYEPLAERFFIEIDRLDPESVMPISVDPFHVALILLAWLTAFNKYYVKVEGEGKEIKRMIDECVSRNLSEIFL